MLPCVCTCTKSLRRDFDADNADGIVANTDQKEYTSVSSVARSFSSKEHLKCDRLLCYQACVVHLKKA